MWWNPQSKIRKIRTTKKIEKRSSKREKNRLTPRPLAIILPTPQKKRRKIEIVISVNLRIITAIKKAIL